MSSFLQMNPSAWPWETTPSASTWKPVLFLSPSQTGAARGAPHLLTKETLIFLSSLAVVTSLFGSDHVFFSIGIYALYKVHDTEACKAIFIHIYNVH